MPPQLKRLVLIFLIIISLFLIIRHFLVPESFGEYGHYRGLALAEIQADTLKYLGESACAGCHDNIANTKGQHEHVSLSCKTCHGPGHDHVKSLEVGDSLIKPDIPDKREFCLICHAQNAARSTEEVAQVDPEDHNAGLVCMECHNPHDPLEMIR